MAQPARPVLVPASQSGHPLLAEEAVVAEAPCHPTAELRPLAVVAAAALGVAEASPYRPTCRPEAMQQGVAAVAEDPSELGLHPAGS